METASICLLLATLSVSPDRSQFFRYDRVRLSCPANWTVTRTTGRSSVAEPCGGGWSVLDGPRCTIQHAYPYDSGEYWCQSQHGCCSRRVNLTVAAGSVILESPADGVAEGEDAVLRCSTKGNQTFDAAFFKDGIFMGTERSGALVLQRATANHQGSYHCQHPTRGESPRSFLLVRERSVPPPAVSMVSWSVLVCGVLLFLFYNVLLVLSVYTYRRWSRAKTDAKTTNE